MKSQNTFSMVSLILFAAALHFSCSAPQSQDAGSGSKTDTKRPTIVTDTNSGCVPTAANNFCKPATEQTGTEKCWAKILGTEAATKCNAAGKVFNRITGVCLDSFKIKAPCTEADVVAAFTAANFNTSSIESNIRQVKENIKTKIGVDAVLDQCAETTTSAALGSKTVLIPFFLGKKFSGGESGSAEYQIHAGKVCGSATDIPACADSNLTFPDKSAEKTPVDCT
jgi:hypothetical protein